MSDRFPTLFIPHGGGPCFFMDWGPGYPADMWSSMADFLRSVSGRLERRPKAVLVISGHWETKAPTVTSAPQNSLIYDYNGFPPHTYQLKYPSPGAPEAARRTAALLTEAGFPCELDSSRGLDHGVFVPFLLIYPDADVPIFQLSLPQGAAPAELLAMGRALAPLRDEDVLIVGSGMTYHNIAGILGRIPNQAVPSAAFNAWLGEVMTDPDARSRESRISQWSTAPYADVCHPTPEHLLPLFMVAGAGDGAPAERIYNDLTLGNRQSAFQFG